MSQIQELSLGRALAARSAAARPARLFYPLTGALLVVLAFVGFSRFYLHGRAYPDREIAAPIRVLVTAHGAAMSAWLVLMLVQPLLILRRGHRLHRVLGWCGAALTVLILGLGVWLSIRSAAVAPPEARIWGLPPLEFMAVPFISSWIFAAFVGLGIYYRRQPRIHRTMMLLATLSAMSAAISRIDALNVLYAGTVWERLFGPFFMTMVLGLVLLGTRSALTRALDRPLALGLGVLLVASVGIMQLAPTPAWVWFASQLVP